MNKFLALDLVDVINEATTQIVFSYFEMVRAGAINCHRISDDEIRIQTLAHLAEFNRYAFRNKASILIINGGTICSNPTIDTSKYSHNPEFSYLCNVCKKVRKFLIGFGISLPTAYQLSDLHREIISTSMNAHKFVNFCDIDGSYKTTLMYLRDASPIPIEEVDPWTLLKTDPNPYSIVQDPIVSYNARNETPLICEMTEKLSKIYCTKADSVIRGILNLK